MCVLKSVKESRGWIGRNQHEEIVSCVARHGELILDVVLCIMHVYRCTEDILLYRFSSQGLCLWWVIFTGKSAGQSTRNVYMCILYLLVLYIVSSVTKLQLYTAIYMQCKMCHCVLT
jgi:hypothetical protein